MQFLPTLKEFQKLLLLTVIYYLLVQWALTLVTPEESISLMWLPDGYVLGILVVLQVRLWPAFLVLAAAVIIVTELLGTDRPLGMILAFYVANLVESLLGAIIFKWLCNGKDSFKTFAHLGYFLGLCVLLVPSISALIGAQTIVSYGFNSDFSAVYATWLSSAGLGILFVAPLVLEVNKVIQRRPNWDAAEIKEFLLLIILVLLLVVISSLLKQYTEHSNTFFVYFSLPILGWAAIKFGLAGGLTVAAILVISSIQLTALGVGPFSGLQATPSEAVFELQTYLGASIILSLFIALAIDKLKASTNKLIQAATVFRNTAEGVVITDLNANIQDVNEAFTEITGYSLEEVKGKNPRVLNSGRHDDAFFKVLWRSLRETGSWRGEIWNRRKNGEIYPELLTINQLLDIKGKKTGYVAVFSDITALKKNQDKLDYIAHHDPLTDLPNRLLLNTYLQQSIRHANRANTSLAIVLIDLDRFKHINDSLGHPAGDTVLIQVAQRLKMQLRNEDVIARVSGDEFVVLLEDVNSPENAAVVVDNLMRAFEQPFRVRDNDISLTASIGISLYPQDTDDGSALLANADAAMFRAKEEGRNTFLFYSKEFTSQAFEHVFLENALQKALERDEFFLVYQPQINLETKQIIGAETLLRWNHPDQGLIPPGRFIPIAEQSGLIRSIGKWVLEMACTEGKKLLDSNLSVGRISVNVAGPQFRQETFVEDVKFILEKTTFPAEHLEMEVTESFVMERTEVVIKRMDELRGLGIQIAIDDFGTGYSSMSYLKELPVDKLKIDQSFIRDIPFDKNDMSISKAIISLAQALDMKVIAEGVETEEQALFLVEHACDEGQGYYFSKPLEFADFETFLKKH